MADQTRWELNGFVVEVRGQEVHIELSRPNLKVYEAFNLADTLIRAGQHITVQAAKSPRGS